MPGSSCCHGGCRGGSAWAVRGWERRGSHGCCPRSCCWPRQSRLPPVHLSLRQTAGPVRQEHSIGEAHRHATFCIAQPICRLNIDIGCHIVRCAEHRHGAEEDLSLAFSAVRFGYDNNPLHCDELWHGCIPAVGSAASGCTHSWGCQSMACPDSKLAATLAGDSPGPKHMCHSIE